MSTFAFLLDLLPSSFPAINFCVSVASPSARPRRPVWEKQCCTLLINKGSAGMQRCRGGRQAVALLNQTSVNYNTAVYSTKYLRSHNYVMHRLHVEILSIISTSNLNSLLQGQILCVILPSLENPYWSTGWRSPLTSHLMTSDLHNKLLSGCIRSDRSLCFVLVCYSNYAQQQYTTDAMTEVAAGAERIS